MNWRGQMFKKIYKIIGKSFCHNSETIPTNVLLIAETYLLTRIICE